MLPKVQCRWFALFVPSVPVFFFLIYPWDTNKRKGSAFTSSPAKTSRPALKIPCFLGKEWVSTCKTKCKIEYGKETSKNRTVNVASPICPTFPAARSWWLCWYLSGWINLNDEELRMKVLRVLGYCEVAVWGGHCKKRFWTRKWEKAFTIWGEKKLLA